MYRVSNCRHKLQEELLGGEQGRGAPVLRLLGSVCGGGDRDAAAVQAQLPRGLHPAVAEAAGDQGNLPAVQSSSLVAEVAS